MFQPQVNANVYRSFRQRLAAVDRLIDSEANGDVYMRTSNQLDQLTEQIRRLQNGLSDDSRRTLYEYCSRLRSRLDAVISQQRAHESNETEVDVIIDGNPSGINNAREFGRPRKAIDKHKLESWLSLGFTVSEIAEKRLLGISVHRNTITSFMKKERMVLPRKRYSCLTDEELTPIIKELSENNPNSGYREIMAFLSNRDPPILIQEARANRLLREIDPIGIGRRWALGIQRRTYHVPTANYLWHMDTHHKLIRWNFVTHGCIDGYSRLVTYLGVSTNNEAITAFNFFSSSVVEFGVPGRVRADGGREFTHIKRFMNQIDDTERFYAGKSVHNQRIERHWRDVFTKVIVKYHSIFNHMENYLILDINNEIHMFALHYVYEPRIQRDLDNWRNAHNSHKIRTESNKTPRMLWHQSLFDSAHTTYSAVRNIYDSTTTSRLQQVADFRDNNNLQEPDNIAIVIQRIPPPLTLQQLSDLKRTLNALAESDSNGIDVYGKVIDFIRQAQSI